MTDTTVEAPATPRLKQDYRDRIVPELEKEFHYSNPMQVARIQKVVVSMGVGAAARDSKLIEGAIKDLTLITGQKPKVTTSSNLAACCCTWARRVGPSGYVAQAMLGVCPAAARMLMAVWAVPWRSPSISHMSRPARARAMARFTASVVLPTPPLVFPIVMIICFHLNLILS